MALNIEWQWTCDVCGIKANIDYGARGPQEAVMRLQEIPAGWSWIHERMVCPKHEIVVDPET